MVLAQNKTAIIISHRLFVTPMVDRILVLEHGRLVEEGTHQQLMKLDGVYVRMFKTQSECIGPPNNRGHYEPNLRTGIARFAVCRPYIAQV
jgi:ABC-type transport system involved in cytochrome bd biosynthesis fused ATPase/permease subunit